MTNNVPVRDIIRDSKLINDYQKGLPIVELVGKYQITGSRIYQVLDHYKVLKRSKNDRPKKPKEK